ncbi:hypothetical protein B1748_35110 [Paenibacillus sp. MY03]|uniref:GH39 family glycosyl hydrolase n=1 Tax=Paenibacillus sp. MY03 TaxID=302980 RepID=UPI000B3CDDE8|nr:hypothetical protein [Paenibacillus sp. MY03]OUS67965.1 hypothetical protein B1748_35110 [Paenibacillus sp. MY03]
MQAKKWVWILFLSLILAFSAVQPVAAVDSDYFGIVEHPHRYTDYSDLIDQIEATQTKWIRISPDWNAIETAKGVYNSTFLDRLDDIVDQLHAKDIKILFILGFTPSWASSNPTAPFPDRTRYKPANWSDWEDYVQFIATRYQGKVTDWEVWNEPDHWGFWKDSVADYKTLLEKAYIQLKNVDPGNRVLMAGLALNDGTQDSYGLNTFFDSLLANGAGDYMDVVNYHAYGSSANLIAKYNGMMDVLNKHGLSGKDIWVTETGYRNSGDKESPKANFVDETYLLHKQFSNIKRIFWYNYRRTGTTGAVEENFGLADAGLNPLKALYYYQAANGAQSFFGDQTENALTLYVNDSPHDSGITPVSGNMKVTEDQYMYFKINDNWLYQTNEGLDPLVYIDVTYLDDGTGRWRLHYDAQSNAYKNAGTVTKSNSQTWITQSFALTDAKFSNSQNAGSDFRIWAELGDLTVKSVTVRKEDNAARAILQTENKQKLMEQVLSTDPAMESYTTVETVGGLTARRIGGNTKYAYFRVSDAFARAGNTNLTIGVQYFDEGTDSIRIQYNSTGSNYQNVYIAKTGTNTWKTAQFAVTNANFSNLQNYSADLRIGNNYDGSVEYIRMVEIIR